QPRRKIDPKHDLVDDRRLRVVAQPVLEGVSTVACLVSSKSSRARIVRPRQARDAESMPALGHRAQDISGAVHPSHSAATFHGLDDEEYEDHWEMIDVFAPLVQAYQPFPGEGYSFGDLVGLLIGASHVTKGDAGMGLDLGQQTQE